MTEEAFLRYRHSVLMQLPDSPYKIAATEAIEYRIAFLSAERAYSAVCHKEITQPAAA
jgi:hypothetical protein